MLARWRALPSRANNMRALCVVVCLALGAGSARAQACNGTASFDAGRLRAGAGSSFTDGARTLGSSLALGQPQGAFGRLGVAVVDLEELSGTVIRVDGTAGGAHLLRWAQRIETCAFVGFSMQGGSGLRSSTAVTDLFVRAFSFALSVGIPFALSSRLDLVPSLQASAVTTATSVTTNGVEGNRKRDFLNLQGGGGLVLEKRLTLQGSVSYPFGLTESNPLYAIGVGFNFRAR